MIYRVAVLQEKSNSKNPRENFLRLAEHVREAAESEADILLLPECYLSCYEFPVSEQSVLATDSELLSEIAALAKENSLAIVATAFTKGKDSPRNSAIVFSKSGERVFQYDKVHTCDWDAEGELESGENFLVREVDGVRLGLMICYDREYPESARILMLKGAEVILVPNDCSQMGPRVQVLATRAYENMVGIAMANPPGPAKGQSCAFSPIVWTQDSQTVNPQILLTTEEESGLFFADFDLDELRDYRSREMMGNTFRKPAAYRALLGTEIALPFIRPGQETS